VDELGLLSVAMRLEEAFGLEERSVSEEALIVESTVNKCVELVSRARKRETPAVHENRPLMFVAA
jgi:hypothetical protein